ncbi:phage tail tape measure protein [Deinococcus misasensis]|uniref:phage tail tape measure protein n=1 Tax=Deinococcus misasensis TaxID=392413 RepID=UPI00054E1BE3|nr:phage tail tape measure protein [Deinococcus misasensis]
MPQYNSTASLTLKANTQGGADLAKIKQDLHDIRAIRIDQSVVAGFLTSLRTASTEVRTLKKDLQNLGGSIKLKLSLDVTDLRNKVNTLGLTVKLKAGLDTSAINAEIRKLQGTFSATGTALRALVKVDVTQLQDLNQKLLDRIRELRALGGAGGGGTGRNSTRVVDPRAQEAKALAGDYQAGTIALNQYQSALQRLLVSIQSEINSMRALGPLTAEQTARMGDLRRQAGQLATALKSTGIDRIKSQLADARAAFDEATRSARNMTEQRAAIQAYTASLQGLQTQLNGLRAAGNLTEKQLTELRNLMARTSREMNTINGGVNTAGLSGNIRNALNDFSVFAPQASMVGMALEALKNPIVAVTVLLGGLGVAAYNTAQEFGKFQKEVANLAAVSQASTSELKTLNLQAKNLGTNLLYGALGAEKFTDMQAELVKAGLDVQDVLGGAAENTALLATATRIQLPEAVKIAAASMTMFGLEGKDMARVTDTIVAGANKSALEVHSLGESLQQAGNMASASNMTIEQTIAYLAMLADRGIKGSDAGTLMKTMLMRLTGAYDEVNKMLAKHNVALFDSEGRHRDVFAIMGDVVDVLDKLDDYQRGVMMVTLGGSDAMRGYAAAYKAGTTELKEYLSKVEDQGIALRTASTQTQNIIDKQNALNEKWAAFKANLGQFAAPALEQLLDKMNNTLDAWNATMQNQDPYTNKFLESVGLTPTDATPNERARIARLTQSMRDAENSKSMNEMRIKSYPNNRDVPEWQKAINDANFTITEVTRKLKEVQTAIQNRKSGKSVTGEEISASEFSTEWVRKVTRQIKLNPEIDSHCAEAASAIMQKLGVEIKASPLAKGLLNNALAAGGKQIDVSQAKPGDLIFFRGPQFGAMKYNENGQKVGYHVEVVDNTDGGKLTTSGSDGSMKLHTGKSWDSKTLANATVIRMPTPETPKPEVKGDTQFLTATTDDLMGQARSLTMTVEDLKDSGKIGTQAYRTAVLAVEEFAKKSDNAARAVRFAQEEISNGNKNFSKANKDALQVLKDSVKNALDSRLRERLAQETRAGNKDAAKIIQEELDRRARAIADQRAKTIGDYQDQKAETSLRAKVSVMGVDEVRGTLLAVEKAMAEAKTPTQLRELTQKQNILLARQNELLQQVQDRFKGGQLAPVPTSQPYVSNWREQLAAGMEGVNRANDLQGLNVEFGNLLQTLTDLQPYLTSSELDGFITQLEDLGKRVRLVGGDDGDIQQLIGSLKEYSGTLRDSEQEARKWQDLQDKMAFEEWVQGLESLTLAQLEDAAAREKDMGNLERYTALMDKIGQKRTELKALLEQKKALADNLDFRNKLNTLEMDGLKGLLDSTRAKADATTDLKEYNRLRDEEAAILEKIVDLQSKVKTYENQYSAGMIQPSKIATEDEWLAWRNQNMAKSLDPEGKYKNANYSNAYSAGIAGETINGLQGVVSGLDRWLQLQNKMLAQWANPDGFPVPVYNNPYSAGQIAPTPMSLGKDDWMLGEGGKALSKWANPDGFPVPEYNNQYSAGRILPTAVPVDSAERLNEIRIRMLREELGAFNAPAREYTNPYSAGQTEVTFGTTVQEAADSADRWLAWRNQQMAKALDPDGRYQNANYNNAYSAGQIQSTAPDRGKFKIWNEMQQVKSQLEAGGISPMEMDVLTDRLVKLGEEFRELGGDTGSLGQYIEKSRMAAQVQRDIDQASQTLANSLDTSVKGGYEGTIQSLKDYLKQRELEGNLDEAQKKRLEELIKKYEELNAKMRAFNDAKQYIQAGADLLGALGKAAGDSDLGRQLSLAGDFLNTGLSVAEKIAKGDYVQAAVEGLTYLIEGFSSASNSYQQFVKNVEAAQKGLRFINASDYMTAEYKPGLFGSSFGATYETKVDDVGLRVAQSIEEAVGNGFSRAFDEVLQTGNWDNFQKTLTQEIGKAALMGLINSFASEMLAPYIKAYTDALKTPGTEDDQAALAAFNAALPGFAAQAQQFAQNVIYPAAASLGMVGQNGNGTTGPSSIIGAAPSQFAVADTGIYTTLQAIERSNRAIQNLMEAGILITTLQGIERNTGRTAVAVEGLYDLARGGSSTVVTRG